MRPTLSDQDYLQAYCDLNCWRWPILLGERPSWWGEDGAASARKRAFARPFMRAVEEAFGRRAILRYRNTVYTAIMSEAEFAAWWQDQENAP